MRRMITDKQIKNLNEISEVAEQGFIVGKYPATISLVNEGEVHVDPDDEYINYETHTFDTSFFFELPRLKEEYGLDGGSADALPYILIQPDQSITMPDYVNRNNLLDWMNSEDFLEKIGEVGYADDEVMIANSTAQYSPEDITDSIVLVLGKLCLETLLECEAGEGHEITGATNPPGTKTLKTNVLQYGDAGELSSDIVYLQGPSDYSLSITLGDEGVHTALDGEYIQINSDYDISLEAAGSINVSAGEEFVINSVTAVNNEIVFNDSVYTNSITDNDVNSNYISLYDVRGGVTIYSEESTITIQNSGSYGVIVNQNDTIISSGNTLALSFNGEGGNGALSIDDEDSGVQYITCYNNLVVLPSLPTSDPQVAGALWNDNGVLKISAGQ